MNPIKKILIIFLLLTCVVVANSQTRSVRNSPPLTEAAPEKAGISAERLDRIDVMCKKTVGIIGDLLDTGPAL